MQSDPTESASEMACGGVHNRDNLKNATLFADKQFLVKVCTSVAGLRCRHDETM